MSHYRSNFFRFICAYNKCETRGQKISLNHERISLTDHEAAVLLTNEFANNFNLASNQTPNIVSSPPLSDSTNICLLNCNKQIVTSTLNQHSNSNSVRMEYYLNYLKLWPSISYSL